MQRPTSIFSPKFAGMNFHLGAMSQVTLYALYPWNFQKWSEPLVFCTFDLEMCFAPQRRALFRHLSCQKWPDHGVFCTVWLRNLLRATTACNFSSLISPAGSEPAALVSLLFDPPEPQIIGKTQCFAIFPPIRASASSFFLLFLFYSSLF